MSTPITPTVGRKVWFYTNHLQAEPIDATVIKVHGTGPQAAVNLDVVDPDTGAHRCVTSIAVGDENTSIPHFRWMPYQQGQAKRAAEVGTATYPDGTAATGTLPLPATSPRGAE